MYNTVYAVHFTHPNYYVMLRNFAYSKTVGQNNLKEGDA